MWRRCRRLRQPRREVVVDGRWSMVVHEHGNDRLDVVTHMHGLDGFDREYAHAHHRQQTSLGTQQGPGRASCVRGGRGRRVLGRGSFGRPAVATETTPAPRFARSPVRRRRCRVRGFRSGCFPSMPLCRPSSERTPIHATRLKDRRANGGPPPHGLVPLGTRRAARSSSTSRTFRLSVVGVNGFARNASTAVRTPSRTTSSSV